MEKNTIKILAIDGGGIRGVIPILILDAIEKKLNALGNYDPFYNLFNLISGTSTGGIIALALASQINSNGVVSNGIELNTLLKIYEEQGDEIFPQSPMDKFKFYKQAFEPKYDVKNFQEILNHFFGDTTLDDCLTNVLIPAFNMTDCTPYFFKKRPLIKGGYKDLNFYNRDIARATSSAPTYFPPAYITAINSDRSFCFVDGGMFANNPSLCAYIEASKIYPNAPHYTILSLGTGYSSSYYACHDVADWGLIGWISPSNDVPLLKSVFNGQRISATHMLQHMPDATLFRINVNLDGMDTAMDNSSKSNIKNLVLAAKNYVNKHQDYLDEIAVFLNS